jgi:hypothetical protein
VQRRLAVDISRIDVGVRGEARDSTASPSRAAHHSAVRPKASTAGPRRWDSRLPRPERRRRLVTAGAAAVAKHTVRMLIGVELVA